MAADDAALRLLGDEAYLAGVASDIMTRVDRDDTFLRLLLHSARRRWQAPVDPAVAARIFSGMILASLLHRHIFHDPRVSQGA